MAIHIQSIHPHTSHFFPLHMLLLFLSLSSLPTTLSTDLPATAPILTDTSLTSLSIISLPTTDLPSTAPIITSTSLPSLSMISLPTPTAIPSPATTIATCLSGSFKACIATQLCIQSFPASCFCANDIRRQCAKACGVSLDGLSVAEGGIRSCDGMGEDGSGSGSGSGSVVNGTNGGSGNGNGYGNGTAPGYRNGMAPGKNGGESTAGVGGRRGMMREFWVGGWLPLVGLVGFVVGLM